jgi:hypothetical protein
MSLPDAHMSGQEEPVAPHLPQAVDPDTHAQSTAPARMETRREKKRREWHEGKISASREKIQRQQESLLVAGSSRTESHFPSATEGKQRHPSYGRTESQWRVIEELKLCACCLTRTTPPHRPGNRHAPCIGQQNAPFDHAKLSIIRKALDKLKAEHRRSESLRWPEIISPQRNRQKHPSDSSANQSQRPLVSPFSHDASDIAGGSLKSLAPLYNVRNPGFYFQERSKSGT